MRQLLLEWGAAKPQTLDNFVVGKNQELAALLQQISQRAATTLDKRFVMIWGESGAGKSHLLFSLAAGTGTRYLCSDSSPAEFDYTPEVQLYLLDDCERLSDDAQIAAFALFNLIRESGGAMITAASLPPAQLPLREDLRTRLAWGLVYQLHGLSDEEKIDALTKSAQARGLSVSVGVIPYLLTHYRRDMRSLSAILDALDRYSLETKRPITMPLLRELLQLDETVKSL